MPGNLLIRQEYRSALRMPGEFMVEGHSNIEDFPAPLELPGCYEMFANAGSLNEEQDLKMLVANTTKEKISGAIAYRRNIAKYR